MFLPVLFYFCSIAYLHNIITLYSYIAKSNIGNKNSDIINENNLWFHLVFDIFYTPWNKSIHILLPIMMELLTAWFDSYQFSFYWKIWILHAVIM